MSKKVVPSDPPRRSQPIREPARKRSLLEELARAGQSAGLLAKGHLELARMEAEGEVRKSLVDTGVGVGAIPLSIAGLLMLDVALALGIASWVGAAWGFLIVGVLNLATAGVLGIFAASRLKRRPRMAGTRAEIERDRAMAQHLGIRLRRQKAVQLAPSPPPSTTSPSGTRPYPVGDGAAARDSSRDRVVYGEPPQS